MNDIVEDEISKKAFTTLTSMGEIAIDVVLGHIAALSIGVTGCVGLGEGLAAAEGAATPSSEIVEAVQAVASCAKDYQKTYFSLKTNRRIQILDPRCGGFLVLKNHFNFVSGVPKK